MLTIKSIHGYLKQFNWLLINSLLFLVPLVFTTSTNEGYEFPKTYLVYIGGLTIIFVFILQILIQKQKIVFPNRYILLFLGIYFISMLFSVHKYTSIWGYYSRFNGGLISVLILFGIYITLVNSYSELKLRRLIYPVLATTVPIVLYAFLQYLNFNISSNDVTRIYSTLGQANWLAGFLVMTLPLTLIYSLRTNTKFKVIWITLFIGGFATLWLTYSLSGFIGFITALVSIKILYIKALKANAHLLLITGLICITIMLAFPGIFKSRLNDVYIDITRSISTIKKVYAIGTEDKRISDTGSIRLNVIKGTWNLIISNPKTFLIGTGPETFPYEFQKYRPKELNLTSEWDFVLNKPHNYYLELWSQIGLLGLVSYLVLIGTTITKENKLLLPTLIGFYLTNFFGWPTIATALLFWVFLAMLDSKKVELVRS